jgi:hypothetical protein
MRGVRDVVSLTPIAGDHRTVAVASVATETFTVSPRHIVEEPLAVHAGIAPTVTINESRAVHEPDVTVKRNVVVVVGDKVGVNDVRSEMPG